MARREQSTASHFYSRSRKGKKSGCGDGHKTPTKTPSTFVGHKKPHRRRRGFPLGDAVELDREAIPRACVSPPAIPGAIPRPPRTRSSFRGRRGRRAGRCHRRAFASPFIFIQNRGILIPYSAGFELDFTSSSIL